MDWESMHISAQAPIDPTISLALISNPPICDNILRGLSKYNSIQLAKSCREAYAAVSSFNRRAHNINARLSRFFPDPDAFRSLQAKTNTLISGSFALQFFDRTFYPESDLDIYTCLEHFAEVGRWLQDLGYVLEPHRNQADNLEEAIVEIETKASTGLEDNTIDYPFRGFFGVLTFFHEQEDALEAPLKIQLIVAVNSPMEVILTFHSTCVMNFITHDRAFSLYPYATFEASKALITAWGSRDDEITKNWIDKYRERGWEMLKNIPAEDINYPLSGSTFPRWNRWVGDVDCWEIHLATERIQTRSEHPFYPRLNGWELSSVNSAGWKAHFYSLRSSALFYQYSLPKSAFWLRYTFRWSCAVPARSASGDVIYDDSGLERHLNASKPIAYDRGVKPRLATIMRSTI